MTDRSETIDLLAAALCSAQAVMRGAKRDANNPFLGTRYADLASCWEAARGPLTSNGLCVVQTPIVGVDGQIGVTTILLHKSGQWISGDLLVPLVGKTSKGVTAPVTAQDAVAAVTYARRCGLSALVGIAPEDDDGESVSRPAREAPPAPKGETAAPVSTSAQVPLTANPYAAFAAFSEQLSAASSIEALDAVAATIGAAVKAKAVNFEDRTALAKLYAERARAFKEGAAK